MNDSTGFWAVALGAAKASGTWEGFRISPLRRTAELHMDGALTVDDGDPDARDYALVLSRPGFGAGPGSERVLVAGKTGTVEFGHDLVELLAQAVGRRSPASIWLTDLATGARGESCELPPVPLVPREPRIP